MRERYQGGSLAGFLIIGGLLTLVLIGGLYGLNRYNAQQSGEEVATSDQPEWPTGDNEAEKRQAKDETPEEKKSEEKKTDETKASERPSQPAAPATTQLPQTGPADSLLNLLALGALTFSGVAYIRSRSA